MVKEFVAAIVEFVRQHEGWAPAVAFLVAFGESFCFLSILWPGTAIMAGIAALLAASGVSQAILLPTIAAAAAGGTIGYAISYWIGLYFKDSIPDIWPFRQRPHLISRGQEFFERYGALGVFAGHFVGPVRAVIPIVAGMFAMPQLPFQIANVASAILWAAGVIAPSYFLVVFKEDILVLLRDYEWVVAAVMLVLAALNAVPRPLMFVPTLVLFVLIGALQLFAGGDFTILFLAGAAGAMVGDLYAYWHGRRFKGDLKGAWPWIAHSVSRARARSLLERFGPVAGVVISKFRGFNRGLVPLMSGATDVPIAPFAVASAVSSLLWSAVLLLPAILIRAIFT